MKLSTREDIEAPIGNVYAAFSDFDALERQIQQRGVALERQPAAEAVVVGTVWQARLTWRGRPHDVAAELVASDHLQGYAIESKSGGVVCMTVVDLVALSQMRTRILVSVDLRPTTLSSRLLLQSLRLAKGRLSERFRLRVADFAKRIEAGGV